MEGPQAGREAPLLSVRDLTIAFGGVRAVDALSFDVLPARVVSLIGPNGAGKTTVLNCVSGFVKASGSIKYGETDLLPLASYKRAGLGIGRTFQNLQLFESMNLLDNVIAGEHSILRGNPLLEVLRFPILKQERQARERALSVLEKLDIKQYASRRVGGLPFGVQKLAGVARSLVIDPGLLLMDEPAAGLNSQEVKGLGRLILSLREEMNLTVLLVEHNMRLVMEISDHIVVLDQGRKLAEGPPHEIQAHPAVVAAYLGKVEDAGIVKEAQNELAQRS